ncbi:MAG TPA: RNA-binding cell elongation regulator Jag/EloR [Actinomycetota bacterium]|nr:RNA-binding cell elongation regulator Jag/EloR [Actinomycetota bacterium]
MREVEGSGEGVDEAVDAALAELGASRDEVDVEVLPDGRSGAPGVEGAPTRVRVTMRDSADAESADDSMRSPADSAAGDGDEPSTDGSARGSDVGDEPDDEGDNEEWLDDQADLVADFLEDLFDAMDLPAEVEPLYEDGTMYVDVWAGEDDENLGILIGRHGAALDALQEIARTVVHHRTGERCQVVVDVEDYRKRRRAQIVSRAMQAARRVQETGRPERLDPMNAYERKIVHDAVGEISGVATASEGEDPDRRVVIRRS